MGEGGAAQDMTRVGKSHSLASGRVLFCRMPGLLAGAARAGRKIAESAPVAVSEGKLVRDACLFSLGRGIYAGQGVSQARRLCASLLVVPLEAVDPRPLATRALDVLADLSPVVEPCGLDAAYVDITGGGINLRRLEANMQALTEFCPLVGVGPSRLAARACAECELPPERLADAAVDWLWPEDAKVVGRLKRLGLETFGQVAALREEDLFYQFGKIGRLLHRRAQGQDLMTVQALYPPPRADFRLEFADYALRDRAMLQAALATAAHEASGQLVALGQYGRRVVLTVGTENRSTERGEVRREWTLPAALQEAQALTRAASRLLMQMPLTAPVTSLRLLVAELERPKAATPDLFAGRMHRDTLALEAARRMLAERYGPQVLLPLSRRPQTVREQRRALEDDRQNEVWQ